MANAMFNYLASLTGWQDLNGDVLVAGQGANPQTLTIRADGPAAGRSSGLSLSKWVELGGAALLVVGLVAGGVYLLSRRLRRNKKTLDQPTHPSPIGGSETEM